MTLQYSSFRLLRLFLEDGSILCRDDDRFERVRQAGAGAS